MYQGFAADTSQNRLCHGDSADDDLVLRCLHMRLLPPKVTAKMHQKLSISISQSKKDIQKLEADRRIAEAQARKERNPELDRKLKERSVMNKDTEET